MKVLLSKKGNLSEKEINSHIMTYIKSPFLRKERNIRELLEDVEVSDEFIDTYMEFAHKILEVYTEVREYCQGASFDFSGPSDSGVITIKHLMGISFGYNIIEGTATTPEAINNTYIAKCKISDYDKLAVAVKEVFKAYQYVNRIRLSADVSIKELYNLA